jgi:hypothetical protein
MFLYCLIYFLCVSSNSTEGVTKFSNNFFSVCLEKLKIIFILSLVFDLLESRGTLKKIKNRYRNINFNTNAIVVYMPAN